MRHVLTLAIPLCFGPCAPREAPAWPPTLHYGDCMDVDRLPSGGQESHRMRVSTPPFVMWPCGGAAR